MPLTQSLTAMDRITRSAFVACVLLAPIARAQQSPASRATPAEHDRQLARAIYKEMIEIKSGYTTGATTPVAEAAARRLRAAGFPDRAAGATINRFCGSSLSATAVMAHAIKAGDLGVGIACGADCSASPVFFLEHGEGRTR